MSELILTLGRQILKRIQLNNHAYTMGRNFSCDLVINDRTVSSEHARIVHTDSDCFLEDLRSTNGTYVNGYTVKQHLLIDGDIIQVGKHRLYYRAKENLNHQISRLCLNPNLLERPPVAWLKMMDGRKAGHIISLEKCPLTLGDIYDEHRYFRCDDQGVYIMEIRERETTQLTQPLTQHSAFIFSGITFKFHQST